MASRRSRWSTFAKSSRPRRSSSRTGAGRLNSHSNRTRTSHPVAARSPAVLCRLVLCVVHIRTAQAQNDVQLWISANTSGAVRGPYRVSAELHGRWTDNVRTYQRTVLRLQAGRAVTEHLTAWFGFEETWPMAGRTAEETRIWQQLIFVRPAGTWALSHRARLEERFIEDTDRMVPRFRVLVARHATVPRTQPMGSHPRGRDLLPAA